MNTRFVMSCSSLVRVFQLGRSLDSGTFSGSQKLPVRRSQTSRSFSSWILFQLMASNTGSIAMGSSCSAWVKGRGRRPRLQAPG